MSGKGWRLTLGETVIVLPSLVQCTLGRVLDSKETGTSHTEQRLSNSWREFIHRGVRGVLVQKCLWFQDRGEGRKGGGGGGGGSDKHRLRCGWDIEVRGVYSFRMLAAWKGWIWCEVSSRDLHTGQSFGVRFYCLAAITILFIDGAPTCVAATQVEHLGKILVKSYQILAKSCQEKKTEKKINPLPTPPWKRSALSLMNWVADDKDWSSQLVV